MKENDQYMRSRRMGMSHLTQKVQEAFVAQVIDGLLMTQAFAFPSVADSWLL